MRKKIEAEEAELDEPSEGDSGGGAAKAGEKLGPGRTVDLLGLMDAQKNVVRGGFVPKPGSKEWISLPNGHSIAAAPLKFEPGSSYKLSVDFTQAQSGPADSEVGVVLPIGGKTAVVALGHGKMWLGKMGKRWGAQSPVSRKADPAKGKKHTLHATVQIKAKGQVMIDFAIDDSPPHGFRGPAAILSPEKNWKTDDRIGFGSHKNSVTFHSAKLTILKGSATVGGGSGTQPAGGGSSSAELAGQDVGNTGLAGSTAKAGLVYTIKGAGHDIWANVDSFHFARTKASGDLDATVRLIAATGTHEWFKIGLMVRGGEEVGAPHAILALSPKGLFLTSRKSSNGQSQITPAAGSGNGIQAPVYLKLVRRNKRVTGFSSPDAKEWKPVGSVEVDLPDQVHIGLVVCSHDTKKMATGIFENFRLNGKAVASGGASPKNKPASARPRTVAAGQSADVLKMVEVNRHAVKGKWTNTDSGIKADPGAGPRANTLLRLPLRPEGDYTLEAEFTRHKGEHDVGFTIPVDSKRSATVVLGALKNTAAWIGSVNGSWHQGNSTKVTGAALTNGKRHKVQITFKRDGFLAKISVKLDGKTITKYSGPASSIKTYPAWGSPTGFGVGTYRSSATFHSLKLKMNRGSAKPVN